MEAGNQSLASTHRLPLTETCVRISSPAGGPSNGAAVRTPPNNGRDGYQSIYNTGNNNYHQNREPIFGSATSMTTRPSGHTSYPGHSRFSSRENDNAFDSDRYQSVPDNNMNYRDNTNENIINNDNLYNNNYNTNGRTNRYKGFGGSNFPSAFGSIGSSDFFNLDGKLAGAAIVNGGPEGATQLGFGGDDSVLGSSLTQGFEPPKGPSFKDIYNKPTGESPLSAGGFSDTVSPEKQNSISRMFFNDPDLKNTVGLTDEDKFIPRESEEEESSTSFHSDSDSNDYEYDSESIGSPDRDRNVSIDMGDNSYAQDDDNRIGEQESGADPVPSPGTDYARAEVGGDASGRVSIPATKEAADEYP